MFRQEQLDILKEHVRSNFDMGDHASLWIVTPHRWNAEDMSFQHIFIGRAEEFLNTYLEGDYFYLVKHIGNYEMVGNVAHFDGTTTKKSEKVNITGVTSLALEHEPVDGIGDGEDPSQLLVHQDLTTAIVPVKSRLIGKIALSFMPELSGTHSVFLEA